MILTIDTENNINACESAPAAQDGLIVFATEKEFTKATAEWPIPRLVETWNGFAGTPPFWRVEAGEEIHGPQDGHWADLDSDPEARAGSRGQRTGTSRVRRTQDEGAESQGRETGEG
jgi:hypothetical protein